MTRYFTVSLVGFIFVVGLVLAQDKTPAQKKKAETGKAVPKNDADQPEPKKAVKGVLASPR